MNLPIYHMGARGVRRGSLYESNWDRSRFIGLVGKYAKKFNATILGWALMTNHYHLLIQIAEELRSEFMKQLNGVYARGYNFFHSLEGHVFEQRGWAFERWGLGFLAHILRYIELNPVTARIAEDPLQYPWSSYAWTIGQKPKPEWFSNDLILQQFSKGVMGYRWFVESFAPQLRKLWAIAEYWVSVNGYSPRARRLLPVVEFLVQTAMELERRQSSLGPLPAGVMSSDLLIYALNEALPSSDKLLAAALEKDRVWINRRRRRLEASLDLYPESRIQLDQMVAQAFSLATSESPSIAGGGVIM